MLVAIVIRVVIQVVIKREDASLIIVRISYQRMIMVLT